MTRKSRYAVLSVVIAVVLWLIATSLEPSIVGNILIVEPVICVQGNLCIFNVKGEENILGKQVAVYIHGYSAPQWQDAWCPVEAERGEKAATWLLEYMHNADNMAVVGAYKNPDSSIIEGRLLVDGYDVADWMIRMGLAAPLGIKVDWCEESPRTMEI